MAVIGIHVSSDYVPASGVISTSDFWIGNVFDSLSRFAVPLFVMLSGSLLLSKEYRLSDFFRKRFVRLLLPFIFWSCVYIAFTLYGRYDEGTLPGIGGIIAEVLRQLRDGSSLHLWYVNMIIGLYLFVPIIGKWVRNSTETELRYFLGIWLVVMLLNQPYLRILKPAIDLNYFSGYLGYFVLGYYLRVKSFGSAKQSSFIGILFLLVGLLSTIFGTWLVQRFTHRYVSTFYEPLSPNILFYATGIFLLLKNKDFRFRPLVLVRDFISRYSYGIYLVHVFVLFRLFDLGINWRFILPLFGIPFTVLLCLSISSVIVFIVNKIPGGKYISG